MNTCTREISLKLTNANLMTALEKKSGDDQSLQDSSSGNNEYLYHIS